jgi:hypothetical protein
MSKCHPCHPPVPTCPPAPAQDVARRNRYDQGAYGLVGGVAEGFCAALELSDAEREELL